MAIRSGRRSSFPAVAALISLILLILLLGFYFENCLKKNVLGVSTFNSAASKNPVTNGETFNFVATVVGDQTGALNGTVLFSLTGSAVINSNIQGPGACLKLTDTTAACNNVNVDPNETIVWTVPVTAASNCSQSGSISLTTRLVATAVTSTSTANVNCVSSQVTATSTPNTNATATPTSQGTNNNGTTSPSTINYINNGGGSGNQGSMAAFDVAGFACSKVSGFPVVFLLFILWLILCAYYFIFRKRN